MVVDILSYVLSTLIDWTVLPSLAFLIMVLVMISLTLRSVNISRNKKLIFSLAITIFLIIWFSFVVFAGKKEFFSKNPFFAPNLFIGFLTLFAILRPLFSLKIVQAVFQKMPVHWLIGVQTYRIVGVGFLILYSQGLLPATFAFPSGIGDILVGITAPVVAVIYYLKKPFANKLAKLWNFIGIADLVIALATGILSFPVGFPSPIQMLPVNPSTELISLYPLVIIPLFAVPLALVLHFNLLKILRQKNLKQ